MGCVIILNKETVCRKSLEVCWYTEYLHIDRLVQEGERVDICQKIGTIANITAFEPHLHYGVGDGDPACWYDGVSEAQIIGNTLNYDDFFCSPRTGPTPHVGQRAPVPGPTPTFFTEEQIQYTKCKSQSYIWRQGKEANKQIAPQLPVNINQGNWKIFFGSAFHKNCEYYALDFFFEPIPTMIGADVLCTCGGCDIESTVVFAQTIPGGLGDLVIIQHSNFPSCEAPPLPPAFWNNLGNMKFCRHSFTDNPDFILAKDINIKLI